MKEDAMAERNDEVLVQLATRVPKTLHRQLKLYCVEQDTSVMDFVVTALREKVARESGRKRARA
jgi:predicted HicB family RNase H-like nuclease